MTKSDPENRAGLITMEKAALLLKITPTYVRQLCREGHIPKPERGMVPLVGAVQGYIDFLKDEERRTSKTAEAAAVHRARAREIELRIAKEEGRLVELQSAEEVFADCIGTFRSELAGIASAATRCLTTRQTIENLIEAAVVRCRERFSKQRDELKQGKRK